MSKKALGKGIDALFSAVAEEPPEEIKEKEREIDVENGVLSLPIESISPNPDQPRKNFNENSLQELSESIRERGILQPVLVQKEGQGYILIAGERRFRAAQLAGLKEIPALLVTFTEEERFEIALIENIQREDLLPIDEAMAYSELLYKTGLNQEELAKKLGKNRSTVANSIRLLKLPKKVQEGLQKGEISSGHARAILSLNTEPERLTLFQEIIEKGLSVRQAEEAVAKKGFKKKDEKGEVKKTKVPVELKEMEQKMIEIFGTKVSINGNLEKGKVEISYFSMDDLDRLYEIMQTRRH